MFALPLSILLIVYGLFVLLFFALIAVNAYHVRHTASVSVISTTVTSVVVAVGILIIIATAALLSRVDWRTPLFEIDSASFSPDTLYEPS